MNKIIVIKNAKELINNIKNNLIVANLCNKSTQEIYKGD